MTRLTRVTRPPGSSKTRAKTVVLWAVLGVGVGAAVAAAALRRPEEVPRVDAPRIDPPPPEVIAPTATVTASTVVAEPSEPRMAPPTTVRRSSARPARFGGLAIDTSPWTEVYLDGRSLGITPLDLRKVPRGTHEIELINAPLGIRKHLRVVIRAGEVTRIYRELK